VSAAVAGAADGVVLATAGAVLDRAGAAAAAGAGRLTGAAAAGAAAAGAAARGGTTGTDATGAGWVVGAATSSVIGAESAVGAATSSVVGGGISACAIRRGFATGARAESSCARPGALAHISAAAPSKSLLVIRIVCLFVDRTAGIVLAKIGVRP